MKDKFTTPVSMKVTEEQFKKDLEQPLKELGYGTHSAYSFKECPIIVNNYNKKFGEVGTAAEGNMKRKGRYFIDHYNPELFLALAAMTDEKDGIAGEHWVYKGIVSYAFKANKIYKAYCEIGSYMSSPFKDDSGERNGYLNNHEKFRKATKEELINHFTKSKTMKEYKVTRADMKRIYDMACASWRSKISDLTKLMFSTFSNESRLSKEQLTEMFNAATNEQLPTLKEIFPDYSTEDDRYFKLDDNWRLNNPQSSIGKIGIRDRGEYAYKGYLLGDKCDWEIITDLTGKQILLPTKKQK